MLFLLENAVGYFFFSISSIVDNTNLSEYFQNEDSMKNIIAMEYVSKFTNTEQGASEINSLKKCLITNQLKEALNQLKLPKSKETLLVADKKLCSKLKKNQNINAICSSFGTELRKRIVENFTLFTSIPEVEVIRADQNVVHQIYQDQFKSIPQKNDSTIIDVLELMDACVEETESYTKTLKDIYFLHFPELLDLLSETLELSDPSTFAVIVGQLGHRSNAVNTDLDLLLPSDLASTIKDKSNLSCGIELNEHEWNIVRNTCELIKNTWRSKEEYHLLLKLHLEEAAPNLNAVVGCTLAARLVKHCGSLQKLALMTASTIQLLGAERDMFKAIKTKSNTPKYGLLYTTDIVQQVSPASRGRASKLVAGAVSHAVKKDVFGEELSDTQYGVTLRNKIEQNIKSFDSSAKVHKIAIKIKNKRRPLAGKGAKKQKKET